LLVGVRLFHLTPNSFFFKLNMKNENMYFVHVFNEYVAV
jgi:hypothetical protein